VGFSEIQIVDALRLIN